MKKCKNKKEVNRILKRNIKSDLFESDNIFAKRVLFSLLGEQEESPKATPAVDVKAEPENFTPEQNQEDFAQSLEPETPQDQFDVEGVSTKFHIENIKKIKTFSDKLDEFASFLNDPHSTESLHKILSDNDKPGSLLRGITRKTSDGITRVAGEIEKLKEVLNSFIILAPKKLRDTEQVSVGG
jgi:patatin-like phospholipase/acyl hydrolase